MKKSNNKKRYTQKDLQKIRRSLVETKAHILKDILKFQGDSLKNSLKDAAGDLSGYSFHMADMATDLYEREFSLQLAEAEREQLFALDKAIKRIDEGVFGLCNECGAPIKKQRIKAMPEAENCIGCQEKIEKA